MKRAILLISALVAASCAPRQPEPADSVPAPVAADAAGDRVVGVVRVVGSAPVNVRVVVQPREGRDVRVVGPLQDELRQLGGAEVALRGPVEASSDPMSDRQIRAESYEILSIEGQPVVTGTVQARSGDWLVLRTPSGETVYLGGATTQLAPGQKVWVQGPRGVIVQSYGVLRR